MTNERIKILVIDDTPANLTSVRALIKGAYSDSLTLTALDGKTGIELALLEDPDLILLDILMPEMDGFEVCQKLKSDKHLSDIPVVFFTAIKGDKQSRIRALEVGAEAFLTKPIDKSELTAQIRAMVKIKASNRRKKNEAQKLSALVDEQTHKIKNDYIVTLTLLDDLKKEIEARKKSKEKLKESERLLASIAENYPNSYLSVIEKDLTIGFASGHEFKKQKLNPNDFIGMTLEQVSGEYAPFIKEKYLHTFKGEETTFELFNNNQYQLYRTFPLYNEKKEILRILSVVENITERKIAEEEIKTLLAEKEVILQEVHHRIKNNMAIICSLLTLQAQTLKEPTAITALTDASNRVKSMALLYDKLYQSPDFQSVSVKEYLSSLVDEIMVNYPNYTNIKIEKQIDDFVIHTKRMQYMGVLINELLTNIMKYAFPSGKDGLVVIETKLKPNPDGEGNTIYIVVQDNGIGIPEKIDFENSTGFGLTLVGILTQQLNGSIQIERENGTRIFLEFPQ